MSCARESKAIGVFAASAPSSVISGANLRASAELCASCACLVVRAVQIGLSSGSIRLKSLPQHWAAKRGQQESAQIQGREMFAKRIGSAGKKLVCSLRQGALQLYQNVICLFKAQARAKSNSCAPNLTLQPV